MVKQNVSILLHNFQNNLDLELQNLRKFICAVYPYVEELFSDSQNILDEVGTMLLLNPKQQVNVYERSLATYNKVVENPSFANRSDLNKMLSGYLALCLLSENIKNGKIVKIIPTYDFLIYMARKYNFSEEEIALMIKSAGKYEAKHAHYNPSFSTFVNQTAYQATINTVNSVINVDGSINAGDNLTDYLLFFVGKDVDTELIVLLAKQFGDASTVKYENKPLDLMLTEVLNRIGMDAIFDMMFMNKHVSSQFKITATLMRAELLKKNNSLFGFIESLDNLELLRKEVIKNQISQQASETKLIEFIVYADNNFEYLDFFRNKIREGYIEISQLNYLMENYCKTLDREEFADIIALAFIRNKSAYIEYEKLQNQGLVPKWSSVELSTINEFINYLKNDGSIKPMSSPFIIKMVMNVFRVSSDIIDIFVKRAQRATGKAVEEKQLKSSMTDLEKAIPATKKHEVTSITKEDKIKAYAKLRVAKFYDGTNVIAKVDDIDGAKKLLIKGQYPNVEEIMQNIHLYNEQTKEVPCEEEIVAGILAQEENTSEKEAYLIAIAIFNQNIHFYNMLSEGQKTWLTGISASIAQDENIREEIIKSQIKELQIPLLMLEIQRIIGEINTSVIMLKEESDSEIFDIKNAAFASLVDCTRIYYELHPKPKDIVEKPVIKGLAMFKRVD